MQKMAKDPLTIVHLRTGQFPAHIQVNHRVYAFGMAMEAKDLERLDGITLQNFWHSLKGTKDMAKHKEEAK